MRSRVLVILAVAVTACTSPSEVPDPSLIAGFETLYGAKRASQPLPAMALSCLDRTRAAVVAYGENGVLSAEKANMLLNRIDNVIKQIGWDHAKPAQNIADSYNEQIQKLVDEGAITAEQAGPIRMAFECIAPMAIAVGEFHSCVLLSDNSAWCWGRNDAGQLGNGSTANSLVPVKIDGLNALQIEAGGSNTCALTSAGPKCWGKNEWGQLGNGSTAGSLTPTAVSWPVSDAVAQLSVGWGLMCGRTAGGETYCWGQNSTGGVGSPNTNDLCSGQFCAMTPVRISTARTYKDVDVGIMGGCALDAEGLAYCWGMRTWGAVGDGVTSERCTIMGILRSQCASEPIPVAGGNHFKSIQFGVQYVCAIRADNDQAMCWGANDGGQLGTGALEPFNEYSPVAVLGGQTFASLTAVDGSGLLAHVCGLDAAGSAYCWGWNEFSQLGAANSNCSYAGEDLTCATSPMAVTGGAHFKQIAVGRAHSCALTTENQVLCWGRNDVGQLGDGSTTDHSAPTAVSASWMDK